MSLNSQESIGIIGAGPMGVALYQGLVRSCQFENILISDRNPEKLEALRQDPGTSHQVRDNNRLLIESSQVIILAIKPKSLDDFRKEYGDLFEDKCLISVLAGTSLNTLSQAINANLIIRAMPNLPVAINQGVIGWLSQNSSSQGATRKLFEALGASIELKDENQFHAFTALAGCGPAYFFYLCDQLESQGQEFGFSKETARLIAEQVFIGAARLQKKSKRSARELILKVASKGGVTQAAIEKLENNGFNQNFKEALLEAVKRSRQLS